MRTSNVAASLLALLLTACSAGENPATTGNAAIAAAVEEVRARMDAYVTEAKAGNVAALPDCCGCAALIAADLQLYEPQMRS
jgi:hypothetical protein